MESERMVLVEGSEGVDAWARQLEVCWRHVNKILEALDGGGGGDCFGVTVYLKREVVEREGTAIFEKARGICEQHVEARSEGEEEEEDDDPFDGWEDYETMMEMTNGVGKPVTAKLCAGEASGKPHTHADGATHTPMAPHTHTDGATHTPMAPHTHTSGSEQQCVRRVLTLFCSCRG